MASAALTIPGSRATLLICSRTFSSIASIRARSAKITAGTRIPSVGGMRQRSPSSGSSVVTSIANGRRPSVFHQSLSPNLEGSPAGRHPGMTSRIANENDYHLHYAGRRRVAAARHRDKNEVVDPTCKEPSVRKNTASPASRPWTRLAVATAILGATGGLAAAPASAQESEDAEPDRSLPTIVVIGKAEDAIDRQPAAVSLVTTEALELRQPRSTEEALRGVPGVAIKPEEETAIVSNIGIRGLSAADYKTLILEDGAPVAPGLFVGNARYYNPRIQRMDSIEVLRGAASLRYGPSTIGGVINCVTKQPRDGVEVGLRAGSFDTREATLELGASTPSGDG